MTKLIRSRESYGWRLALTLDQLANVLLSPLLNRLLPKGHKDLGRPLFGFEDETLSSVFGKNVEYVGWCKTLCKWLSKVDNNHCKKAIEEDEGDYRGG